MVRDCPPVDPEKEFIRDYRRWRRGIERCKHVPRHLDEINHELSFLSAELEDAKYEIDRIQSKCLYPLQVKCEEAKAQRVEMAWNSLPWWRRRLLSRPVPSKIFELAVHVPASYREMEKSISVLEEKIHRIIEEKLGPLEKKRRQLTDQGRGVETEKKYVDKFIEETKTQALWLKEIRDQRKNQRKKRIDQRKKREDQREKQEERDKALTSAAAKYDRHLFLIRNRDYRRGNMLDNFVRKRLRNVVLNAFDDSCVQCESNESLVFDHFAIQKNSGGNFILFNPLDHSFTLNVAILCHSCNSAKKETSPFKLLRPDQLARVEQIYARLLPELMKIEDLEITLCNWYEIDGLEHYRRKLFDD